MKNIFPAFFLFSLPFAPSLLAESVEEEQGDPYYGVPLGALHYSAEGTSAEVYAADEFSIIFNHFYHNPREQGCTAMMIGPPRTEDKDNVVPGHGILLTMAHEPAAVRHKMKRAKRGATRTGDGRGDQKHQRKQQQFLGYWPAEFDHLLMEPTPAEVKTEPKQQQQKKEGVVTNKVNLSNTSVTDQLIQNARLILDNDQRLLPSPAAAFVPSPNGTVSLPSLPSSPTTTATTTAMISVPAIATVNATSLTSSRAPSSSSPSPVAIHPTISTKAATSSAPIILLPNKRSKEGHQSQKQTLAKEMATDFAGESKGGRESEIRRAPARQNAEDEWAKANELDEKGIPPTQRTAPKLSTTTPATTTAHFWVIKDPREARRERLLQLRRKLDPNPEPPTTTTTSAPLLPLSPQFELHRIRDKLVTFSLTNGAKITQYKWIGLWNQCNRRHIPLVSLRDVDPPREEKIMPLSGWSHNVTSYRLHILNCNTILIPSFHYDSRNTTRNTFFFVGVGQFPEAVEQQVKANVVGTRPGEPLRSYKGEDLMLRLPRPYRTFDIDFISIFNMDEQKSFGHVIMPSLLVPPCPDDE
ncbi:hypothetical protein niasHS_007427 [Heterodera schachtii]|uniref:DM13 domain-containing protein n=1 Tax=Heterodera schachtii TaxID=97005 RepID=A0ABD2JXK2_HETSC